MYVDNYISVEQAITYCYPFQNVQNLTEYEALLANHICDIQWANYDIMGKLDDSRRQLQGITIASLVLNAVTVLCILLYLLYSLYSFYRRKQKEQAVAL